MSLNVLEEAQGWLQNPNSVCDPRPQMSWVVLAESLPCCAEGLARVAARQDVHFSVKLGPREGLNIRPDRCWVQASRFHFCDQVRAGERFDFTKSDRSQTWDCSFKSEINASVPSAEADVCNWLGSIHVIVCRVVGGWATLWPRRQGLVATEPQIVSGLRFWGKTVRSKSPESFSQRSNAWSCNFSG